MLCPRCHTQALSGEFYCRRCGSSLTQEAGGARPIILGRGREADFQVAGSRVSQRHASLTPQGGGRYLLRDLGSSNGVFAGSPPCKVQEALVGPEDFFFLADKRVSVREIIGGRSPRPESGGGRRYRIGRAAENDLTIDDSGVSRFHAVLINKGADSWALEDAGSQNGSFVNGRKIDIIALNYGDSVKLGTYALTAAELIARVQSRKIGARSGAAGLLSRFSESFPSAPAFILGGSAIIMALFGVSLLSRPSSSAPAPGPAAKVEITIVPPAAAPPQPAPPGSPLPSRPEPSRPEPVRPEPSRPEPVRPEPSRPEPAPPAEEPPAPAAPKTSPAPNINEMAERATVLVGCEYGRESSLGTGFFIAPNLVLTNRHVVVSRNAACWIFNKTIGHSVKVEVIALSGSGHFNDFAVLRSSGNFSVTPLNFSLKAKKADRVTAWGYPGLLLDNINDMPEASCTDGLISLITLNPPLIHHTAVISPGNSGGPLINEAGRVIGVNTLGISDPSASFREDFGALTAADIISFLRANKLPYTIAE